MKLYISGDVNTYYVQTLCMIFFPGEKFSGEEEEGAPVLYLDCAQDAENVTVTARLCYRGKETRAVKTHAFQPEETADRTPRYTGGGLPRGKGCAVGHNRGTPAFRP